MGDSHAAVVGVCRAEKGEERGLAVHQHLRQLHRQVFAFQIVDGLEFGLDGIGRVAIEVAGSHGGVVEVLDFLLDGAGGVLLRRDFGHQLLELLLVVLCQYIEAAVTGVFVAQRVGSHPAAAGILVEICRGLHVFV